MNHLRRTILPELRARRLDGANGVTRAENLLTRDQQASLQNIATLTEIRRGGTIFSEGTPAEFFYLMARGMARISRVSQSGRRQVMAFKMPGDLLGYPEQGVYGNTGLAVSAVTLYRLPWHKLTLLWRRDSELHASFLARITSDVRQAQKRLMALGQQNVGQRLASFLLEMCEHSDFYDPQRQHLVLPLTRFDLADYLGTTPETVARVLARLERDGLLRRLTARLLEIRDYTGLLRLLEERRRNG